MSTTRRHPRRLWFGALAAVLCVGATRPLAHPRATAISQSKEQANDAAAFKAFGDRVQGYLKLQKTVESSLPTLKPTDLPEMIAAHQQALARKIREARPQAKAGDLFTSDAAEAFRHASRVALTGLHGADAQLSTDKDAADPNMPLAVNGIYPGNAAITAIPPGLLAAFPPLPPEVAYRIVGRTLVLVDVKSSVILDLARGILPPPHSAL